MAKARSTKTTTAPRTAQVEQVTRPGLEQARDAEPVCAPESKPHVSLLLCAHPGTEEKMRALWNHALGEEASLFDIRTLPVYPDGTASPKSKNWPVDLCRLAERIVSDTTVGDEFILVPANTFPTARMRWTELYTPFVYVEKSGRKVWNHCLPKAMTKDVLTDALLSETQPDALAEKVARTVSRRQVEAGMSFGNIVTPVRRSDPCEHLVIEALVRKKYVAAETPGAWSAIEHLVDKLLSE